MARYRVLINPSAGKETEKADSKEDRQRIVRSIRKLANDPRPPGCTKLLGRDRYRVRQGRYRIISGVVVVSQSNYPGIEACR